MGAISFELHLFLPISTVEGGMLTRVNLNPEGVSGEIFPPQCDKRSVKKTSTELNKASDGNSYQGILLT